MDTSGNTKMSIEQKAWAYDGALNRAKAAIDNAADKDLVKGVVTAIFPLLREGQENNVIDIPFGAHDSELKGWEYTIPEGMEAIIKDGKVIVKEKASEDERIRRQLINVCNDYLNGDYSAKPCLNDIKWLKNLLEKQKINTEGDFGRGYDCGYEACLNSHGAEWFEKQKEKSEKLIIPEKENEAMKAIESIIRVYGKTQGEWIAGYDMDTLVVHLRKAFAALEKQKEIPMSDSIKMIKMWDEEKKILERMYLRGDTWRLIAYNAFIDGIARGNLVKFEKQKEQKPDSLIYDKDLDKDAREFYLSGGADSPVDSTGLVPIVRMAEFGATWMKERMEKEQKSAEWSEEDEDKLEQCIRIVSGWEGDYDIVKSPYSNFLKSLRPSWKPSDEQMQCLLAVITNQYNAGAESCHLTLGSLYNDLKKLI